jgi:hypothetical protein
MSQPLYLGYPVPPQPQLHQRLLAFQALDLAYAV